MRTNFYVRLRDLPVTISSFSLAPLIREVADGFERSTTLVTLHGLGASGKGEELTFQRQDQENFCSLQGQELPLIGKHTINTLSNEIEGSLVCLPKTEQNDSYQYRRWAFESAALDLALRQNGVELSSLLGLKTEPVHFVASLRLDNSLNTERLQRLLRHQPGLTVKLDVTSDWTPEFMRKLADKTRIAVLDFKAFYHGTRVDQPPDSTLYEIAARTFPKAILEDLDTRYLSTPNISAVLARSSYDEPIRSTDDVQRLGAKKVNIKPARIGSLRRLFEMYAYCLENNVEMYGGGLFELGVGRTQIQYLASIFHPSGTNDVAPVEYNFAVNRFGGLPSNPLWNVTAFGANEIDVS